MNKHLELQLAFQKLAGQTVGDINYVPTVEERKLRLKLALEELTELAEAYGLVQYFSNISRTHETTEIDTEEYNAVEALDATVDIAVINNGTIITCGLHNVFDKNYELVDTNNKTKFHTDYLEALKTQKYYTDKNTESTISEIIVDDIVYFTVLNSFGKVLKPYNYESVKLDLNE